MSAIATSQRLSRAHEMPYGAQLASGERVRFRVWAPGSDHLSIALECHSEPLPMKASGDGWFELETDRARVGSRYSFVLPDGFRVPDPASRFQPDDVHGPSEVIDPAAYHWSDYDWPGRPWHEAVVYELHVGAFTPEGTFAAARRKLDHLATLGVTAIEVMPVADFPGRRNWGYDGVLPYAPDSSYGRPEDFKAFVDAAHARGLMVILDVVYNHFGPEGNYLPKVAPQFFTDRHKTPWGAAVNYDGADARPVREFVIHNALYWIEEFHLDGLRLDAVHAIIDESPKHILKELAERVRGAVTDRAVHLILENEENEASLLGRVDGGRPLWFTAQWNDDMHHVLHTAATSEDKGYYKEYLGDTEKLARALAEGFAFQGQMMTYRGEKRGEPSAHLQPDAFVAFIQNHDQVGNRAFGDRIGAIAEPEAVRAIASIYLLLPQIPMLFMGEEWNASQPFPFFCDFSGDLADAVRKGRREEFAKFPEFQDPATREKIPDPEADETFQSAKLDWGEMNSGSHRDWMTWYRDVLAVRKDSIVPALRNVKGNAGRYEILADSAVVVRWTLDVNRELTLAANLSGKPVAGFPASSGNVIWREGNINSNHQFGPWTVRWAIEHAGEGRV